MREIDIYCNAGTSKGKKLLEKASHEKGVELYQVYGKYSREKARHYEECKELYNSMWAIKDFRICSFNKYGFTCAWECNIENKDVCIFCTPCHTYCIFLDY